MAAHAIFIVKEEEKELRTIDGLSKDKVYPIVEIDGKWCSFHKTSTHDSV